MIESSPMIRISTGLMSRKVLTDTATMVKVGGRLVTTEKGFEK